MNPQLLEGVPLLAGLSEKERREIAGLFETRFFLRQTPVFWHGDAGHEMFIIREGEVSISCPDQDGREITLARLGPGEMFGEISLLDSGPRTATARAVADTSLLVLGREAFGQFIARCPSTAMGIMTTLSRRHREGLEKLRGIKNLNEVMQDRLTAWQRVANVIARAASSAPFLLIHAVGVLLWLSINIILGQRAIDPFPFMFLCFWTSTEAIFLSLFILVSQDQQGRKDRIRTELEYQVAPKTQLELMQLHEKVDRLRIPMRERSIDPDEEAVAGRVG